MKKISKYLELKKYESMHVKTCGVMSINKVFRVNTLLPSQSIWGKGPVWVPPPQLIKDQYVVLLYMTSTVCATCDSLCKHPS